MLRRLTTLVLTVTGLILGGVNAFAHEEFRVIGTLLSHQDSRIAIQGRDGRTMLIQLDKQTAITKDGQPVDAAELTAGRSVVVDAFGDSEEDLLAIEIRIVPPIAAP
jgi:hypothetical protein